MRDRCWWCVRAARTAGIEGGGSGAATGRDDQNVEIARPSTRELDVLGRYGTKTVDLPADPDENSRRFGRCRGRRTRLPQCRAYANAPLAQHAAAPGATRTAATQQPRGRGLTVPTSAAARCQARNVLHTGQTYVERPPAPALAGAVASVWVQRVAADAAPYTHRTVPNGSVGARRAASATSRTSGDRGRAPSSTPSSPAPSSSASASGPAPPSRARPAAAGAPRPDGRRRRRLGPQRGDAGRARTAGARRPTPPRMLEAEIAHRLDGAATPDPSSPRPCDRLMPWRATRGRARCRGAARSPSASCAAAATPRLGVGPKALQRMLRFQGFLALVQRTLAATGAPPTTASRGSPPTPATPTRRT